MVAKGRWIRTELERDSGLVEEECDNWTSDDLSDQLESNE